MVVIEQKSALRFRQFLMLAVLILLAASFLRIADLRNPNLGLHYDEAADLLLTRDVAFYHATPFPVVSAYSGREALFYFMAAPLTRIIGVDPFATRLSSAFLGILTVAVTIALGKAMFRGQLWIGLFAGALLAVNGAEVWLSRQGFRTSPQPLFIALSCWLLFVALYRKRWQLPMIASGVSGGGALYVYIAARVYPIWWVLVAAISIILVRRTERTRALRMLVGLFALLITALPLIFYFVNNPSTLLDRLSQVAPGSGTISLFDSVIAHLKMFFIQGEPILRYNFYVGRPFFDLVTGGLMVIGITLLVVALFRRSLPITVIVWTLSAPLLIAPSLIAVGGFPPNHMRSVTMVPLIFMLPALGLNWLTTRLTFRYMRAILLIVLLVVLGTNTWGDYRSWVARADRFYDSDGDLNAAANWLTHNAAPDDLIYIWSVYYEHPTVLAHPLEYTHLRWMMRDQLFIAPPQQQAWYVLPRSVQPDSSLIKQLQASGATSVSIPASQDSQPDYQLWWLPAAVSRPIVSGEQTFGGFLRVGQTTEQWSTTPTGERRQLTLLSQWGIQGAAPQRDYQPNFTLFDACDNRITPSTSVYFDHTDNWRVGEVLYTAASFILPRGEPASSYQAQVVWARREPANQYAPVMTSRGFAGIAVTALKATIAPDPWRGAPPSEATLIIPSLYAQGTALSLPTQIDQGESLVFAVQWSVGSERTSAKRVNVSLTRPETGERRTIYQGYPSCNTIPFSDLEIGQTLLDRYRLPIPPELPPGNWRAELTVEGSAHAVISQLIQVRPVARQFTAPTLPTSLSVTYGDAFQLVGAEIKADNTERSISLGWKALRAPDSDYTVFVHVKTSDGAIFSQQDAQPARPTHNWIAGEYFIEQYHVKVPAEGAYQIQVGLYQLESGVRLPIHDQVTDYFVIESR